MRNELIVSNMMLKKELSPRNYARIKYFVKENVKRLKQVCKKLVYEDKIVNTEHIQDLFMLDGIDKFVKEMEGYRYPVVIVKNFNDELSLDNLEIVYVEIDEMVNFTKEQAKRIKRFNQGLDDTDTVMAMKTCPKCKKEHLTEVDSMGVAYKRICPECTRVNRKISETHNVSGINRILI